jgi:hypothetical protein
MRRVWILPRILPSGAPASDLNIPSFSALCPMTFGANTDTSLSMTFGIFANTRKKILTCLFDKLFLSIQL